MKFIVYGEPKGKARPFVPRKGHAFTPQRTVLYENLIKTEYERQCGREFIPHPKPVSLYVMAYYSIPKSANKKKHEAMLEGTIRPIKKSDIDNVIKVVADSLCSIAYDDDIQVVQCYAEKFYSDEPRIEVVVTEIES